MTLRLNSGRHLTAYKLLALGAKSTHCTRKRELAIPIEPSAPPNLNELRNKMYSKYRTCCLLTRLTTLCLLGASISACEATSSNPKGTSSSINTASGGNAPSGGDTQKFLLPGAATETAPSATKYTHQLTKLKQVNPEARWLLRSRVFRIEATDDAMRLLNAYKAQAAAQTAIPADQIPGRIGGRLAIVGKGFFKGVNYLFVLITLAEFLRDWQNQNVNILSIESVQDVDLVLKYKTLDALSPGGKQGALVSEKVAAQTTGNVYRDGNGNPLPAKIGVWRNNPYDIYAISEITSQTGDFYVVDVGPHDAMKAKYDEISAANPKYINVPATGGGTTYREPSPPTATQTEIDDNSGSGDPGGPGLRTKCTENPDHNDVQLNHVGSSADLTGASTGVLSSSDLVGRVRDLAEHVDTNSLIDPQTGEISASKLAAEESDGGGTPFEGSGFRLF